MLLTYLSLVAFCVVFVEMFIALDLLKDSKAILATSRESMTVVTSKTMSDEEKEKYMRRGSLAIFKATLFFILKFLSIAAVLGGLYYLLKVLSVPLAANLAQVAVEWKAIIFLTVVSMIYVWGRGVILRRL